MRLSVDAQDIPSRPAFFAASSATYIAATNAPPSFARSGWASSASRNLRLPWALHPASMTRPDL